MTDYAQPESLVELGRAFASGDLQTITYLATLEDRCARAEPKIQSLMDEPGRFDRVHAELSSLSERFPESESRTPLYGVPIGVKDIFRVDGLATTAGSKLPTHLFEGEASTAVRRLRGAGAVVLGKTVSTEFAYFGPGPTRNPRDLARTPGGSSSGSAAAVAAGLTPLALGTQTIGSISRPAAYCGVVGYKPSYDRISRAGVIPLSPTFDHIGTFTADAASAAIAASVLADDWNPSESLDRPRLAIPKGPMLKHATPEALHHLKAVSDHLSASGFEVQVVPSMLDFDDIVKRHRLAVAVDAAAVHSNWYADYGALYHPKTVALLSQGWEVSEEEANAARAGGDQLRQELTALMIERGVDLWISPPAQGVAPEGIDSTGDPIMNLAWSHSGLPTLTLPAGTNEAGLPLGLQIAAGWRADEKLLAWGQMLEAALATR